MKPPKTIGSVNRPFSIQDNPAYIEFIEAENERLKRGISCVRGLINDSVGVVGLHHNGDVAEWRELESGGEFECWLKDFNEAEQ